MRMPFDRHSAARGQTSLEYLLLLAIVAVIVIAGFSQGGLISKVHDAAQGYYGSATRVIMGETPAKINGGWCGVTCPLTAGFGPRYMYGACECPAPAFGGDYCLGASKTPVPQACSAGQTCFGQMIDCSGSQSCSCPTGQVCVAVTTTNPTGCACPSGLLCGQGNGPAGSIPDSTCTVCQCPSGSQITCDGSTCAFCPSGQYLPNAGDPNYSTTTCPVGSKLAGTSQVACASTNRVCNNSGNCTCPTGIVCDPNKNWGPSPDCLSCDCFKGAYIDPNNPANGCHYCGVSNGQCTTSTDGKTCTAIACPSSTMYCDTTVGDPNYNQCRCPSPTTCWNGASCVNPDTSGNCPACVVTSCTATFECGSSLGVDNCGNPCNNATPGTCKLPKTCSSALACS